MEQDRMINVLLEIKADVSDLKRGHLELKEGQNRIESRLYKIEDDFRLYKTSAHVSAAPTSRGGCL